MKTKRNQPPKRSVIAKDLFTPKYRSKVVPNKKRDAKAPRIELTQ